MFTLSRCLAAAAVLWASPPAQARSVVTLHNLTERDLCVAHARGPGATPITVSPCLEGLTHPCCPGEPAPFGGRAVSSDGLPEAGRPRYEYWLGRGQTVTFVWDEPGEEVTAEVHLQAGDDRSVRACHGLLIYPVFAKLYPEPMD